MGKLRLKGNGFVYLDVSNDFLTEIASLIPANYPFDPLSPKGTGAHISAIYEEERIKNESWNLQETGEWFSFEVKELRYVDVKSFFGHKRTWLLAVDAPGLQRHREMYGLKPKLQNHDFHITIGYERLDGQVMMNLDEYYNKKETM